LFGIRVACCSKVELWWGGCGSLALKAGTPALKVDTSRTVGWNLEAGLGLGRALRGTALADEHGGAD
jgi:hypothetical protein